MSKLGKRLISAAKNARETLARDIEKQPYTADEARVAAFFCERGIGGGDDPIGAVLAGYAYLVAERNEARRDLATARAAQLTLLQQVSILTNERDEARARSAT